MKKSFKLLIIINIISVMIASILTLQIFATPNYQSFENKTGSIVEEINITYVLKNATYITSMVGDKNGIIAYVRDLNTNKQIDNSRYIYIDYNGNVTECKFFDDLSSDYFKYPSVFCEGIARIKKGNKQGYINEKYEWIANLDYYSISNFSNGYGAVKKVNGKSYLLNINGEVCMEADDFYYNGSDTNYSGTAFQNGYAAYSKNEEFFYLDENLNSTKIMLDDEFNFNDGKFMFNGGTLAYMYPEIVDGNYTHKQIYCVFGHDGKEKYRYIVDLPELEPVNSYDYINILANGNVVFETPDDFNDNFCKSKVSLVTNNGEVLAENREFDRYDGMNFVSIGDKVCYVGNFYDSHLKKLDSISLKGEYFDTNDGSVVGGLEIIENKELNEITINKLVIVRDVKTEIAPNIKLVDPDKVNLKQNIPKNIMVFINKKQLNFDVPPITENDRTLVPMRAIFEALGAEVEWENETRTATATKNGITVSVTIDSNKMQKNAEEIKLDVPARLVGDSRTLVPLRAISEAFGCRVEWDEKLQRVDIYTN